MANVSSGVVQHTQSCVLCDVALLILVVARLTQSNSTRSCTCIELYPPTHSFLCGPCPPGLLVSGLMTPTILPIDTSILNLLRCEPIAIPVEDQCELCLAHVPRQTCSFPSRTCKHIFAPVPPFGRLYSLVSSYCLAYCFPPLALATGAPFPPSW
jgi:hypothetical protein